MLHECLSLKKLNNQIKFNINNANNMSYKFYFCSLLKEINLSNFNANNIIDMRHLFCGGK